MKIYTRTGDDGNTSIIGGRVGKDDVKVEAYGTIDELNGYVGYAAALLDGERDADMRRDLTEIQHELFDCGSDLAYADTGQFDGRQTAKVGFQFDGRQTAKVGFQFDGRPFKTTAKAAERLEAIIDRYEEELPPITRFILPGGSAAASMLHVCRTVCRRAERRTVTLTRREEVNPDVLKYLNRLSDLFFTLARVANVRQGIADVEYVRSAEVFKQK